MHGIPRAPGRRAYSSVGREVGAVCVERLAVFVSNIQLSFRSVVQKTACLRVRIPFWVQLQVCRGVNANSGELGDRVRNSCHVGFL